MTASEQPTKADPLDLLRRFIPTPFQGAYEIDGVRVNVQTNDLTLMPALRLIEGESVLQQSTFEWKLVRDEDSESVLDVPRTFTSGPVTFVEMGSACFFGLDQERRELLGFIGTRIDARTYQDFIVPLLGRMTSEACCYGDELEAPEGGTESAND
jgi:hypothetical protein